MSVLSTAAAPALTSEPFMPGGLFPASGPVARPTFRIP